MAEIVKTIRSTGGDYTTFAAWEAARMGTIASGDQEVAEMYDVDVPCPYIPGSGWTFTDITSRIIIRASTANKHTGTPATGTSVIGNPFSSGIVIGTSTPANITFDGMEVRANAGTHSVPRLKVDDGGNASDVVFDDVIFYGQDDTNTGNSAIVLNTSTNANTKVTANNCVMAGFPRAITGINGDEDKIELNFCTVFMLSGGSWGVLRAKCTNVIAMGDYPTGDFFDTAAGSDFNISSDTTAPGTNNLQSKGTFASYFTDHTNHDFSLLGTTDDGGIFGATGLAGTAIAGITTDVIGTTRTTPDIGAFEVISTPPPSTSPDNFTGTGADQAVNLSWDAVVDADSYKVTWGTSTGPTGGDAILGILTTSYEHTGRTNGVEYFYVVAAVNGGGAGPNSDEISVVAGVTGASVSGISVTSLKIGI